MRAGDISIRLFKFVEELDTLRVKVKRRQCDSAQSPRESELANHS